MDEDKKSLHNIRIYQVLDSTCPYIGKSYNFALKHRLDIDDYTKVFEFKKHDDGKGIKFLDKIYVDFFYEKPQSFKGRNIGVGDIIGVDDEMFYIDSAGYIKVFSNEQKISVIDSLLNQKKSKHSNDDYVISDSIRDALRQIKLDLEAPR